MVHLAALLAGFGGLLLEMLFVRRHGLLIGNTAGASATILALFLLGLGVGGLWLPRTEAARRRPLGSAAVLYAAVAAAAAIGDVVLRSLPPLGPAAGIAVAVLVPGLPAVLMGGAFPLLFAALPRYATGRVAWLIAANLAGSVVATFVGGNFAIPSLGMTVCAWLGAAAYGLAAALVAVRSRWERRPTVAEVRRPPPLAPAGRAELTAAAAGFAVLGLEVYLLRRLPFFLDGFQPTLSGVLAACLLALTAGAIVGPPLLRRLFGARAATGSVVLGALFAAAGLHEWAAPWVGRIGVTSDLGFHLRIVAAATVAAGLPCLCFGATIPLCLERFVHPETRAPLAGRLFFFQGIGSLLGALFVGHALPHLLPESFFRHGVSVVLVVTLAAATWRQGWWIAAGGALVVVGLGVLGVTGGQAFRHHPSPVAGSRYDRPDRYRYLAHRTDEVLTASVVYDRSTSGLILFTDEFRAAYIDADSGYMKVLGHLPFLLRRQGELARTAVVALGTGTTANAVQLWPDPRELHVVEISSAVVAQVDHFAKAGPARSPVKAPFRTDPRTRVHVTDGRRFVARRPPGSLDLISMEPLLPYAPGTVPLYTREFYAHAARALSARGLMVQWVPTHSMPAGYFRTLLATFARSFAHHSVWLLDHSTLLVGSQEPHLPPIDTLRGRLAEMPAAARRDLHAAGIAAGDDLVAAFVGADALRVCGGSADLRDDRPFLERLGYWSAATKLAFLPDNLGVLERLADRLGVWPGGREWRGVRIDRLQGLRDLAAGVAAPDQTHDALAVLALGRTRDRLPDSVLLFGELQKARRARIEKEVRAGIADRAALARHVDHKRLVRYLDQDSGSALLWAVHGALEPRELEQHRALRMALALDPTIYTQWPALRPAWVPAREIDDHRGPFEDLALLPRDDDLRRRAAAASPAGNAFRVRYRVAVGYAYLAALAREPLAAEMAAAFRAVLDPALLAMALRRVRSRGGDLVREVLPLWRADLAMPAGLAAVGRGDVAAREAFAGALSGRRGFAEVAALARLLEDEDVRVRRVAGVSLFQTFRDKIEFDPQAPAAERRRAAEALRRLNRGR